ncbi:MAG TPA: hypothetical protein VFM37_08385 [Pseudonocardiaceae bacterium]|nr:hypothetical protein [Pseudonocardiaceae bacterium]
MTEQVAAEVAGEPVLVSEVDRREAALRGSPGAAALPARGTSEGRQLRRWITQLIVAERLVAIEAGRRGLTDACAPGPLDVLPDPTARVEIGSVPATLLDSMPLARALFADLTCDVDVPEAQVDAYHRRNPGRFARPQPDAAGWRIYRPGTGSAGHQATPLPHVRSLIEKELGGAARRRTFARWLDAARDDLVRLRPGFEHPGDPAQPDNTHRH